MTSAVRSLLTRLRRAAPAVPRTVHPRHEWPAHFFRGVLIGLAILVVIWLLID
jgi:hypothetical protein